MTLMRPDRTASLLDKQSRARRSVRHEAKSMLPTIFVSSVVLCFLAALDSYAAAAH